MNLSTLLERCKQLKSGEAGAVAVEHAVLLGLVLLACVASVRTLGNDSSSNFEDNAQRMFEPEQGRVISTEEAKLEEPR